MDNFENSINELNYNDICSKINRLNNDIKSVRDQMNIRLIS